MYKRILTLIALCIFTLTLTSCVTTPKIQDYQAKNQTEKEIVGLFIDGLKAWDAGDKAAFLSIYCKDLVILTDGENDWEEDWFSYDEYANFVESKMKRYKEKNVTVEQFEPKKLIIERDKAHIEIEYHLYTPGYAYQEKGIIYADLKKTTSGWCIYKRWFEYLCASYNPTKKLPKCY